MLHTIRDTILHHIWCGMASLKFSPYVGRQLWPLKATEDKLAGY